jgi:glycosyltransferase involved in cell wall biosynthesis
MISYPKISIVTPNLNGIKYLEHTILSVVSQNYPNLEYIVMDGGSTDGSVELIRKYENQIAFWESKPDQGLYDALQQGFARSTGEIMGWINSDDILCFNSLFSVAEIFSNNAEINWIQGYPTVIDDQNRMVYQRPPVFSKLCHYLKDYKDGRFIQQESTFWTRSLWNQAGGFISQEYKFAGDFELWIRFFNHSQIFITSAVLGSFRMRKEGQLSVLNYQNYLSECDQIIDKNEKCLSENEKRAIKHIQKLRKIQNFLSPLTKLLCVNCITSKLLTAHKQINFNFDTYRFK